MRLFISMQMAHVRKLAAQKMRYTAEQRWDRYTASQSQSKVALMWRGLLFPRGLCCARGSFRLSAPPPFRARGEAGRFFLGIRTTPNFLLATEMINFVTAR